MEGHHRGVDLSEEEDGDETGELVSGETVKLAEEAAGVRVTSWRLLAGTQSVPLCCVDSVAKKGADELEVATKDGRRLLLRFGSDKEARRRVQAALALPVALEHVFAFGNPQLKGRPPSMELLATLGGTSALPPQVRLVQQPYYALCSTYPPLLVVPAGPSDAELARVARFRARGRLPVLSYWREGHGAVLRCAQPNRGVGQRVCREDEAMMAPFAGLLLFDARPRAAAVANAARGGGTEKEARYEGARLVFGNIANIHAARKDARLLASAVLADDDEGWPTAAAGWLRHVAAVLGAANLVAAHSGAGQPVLVHCSDGWDRTAQVASLATLLLDPRSRTTEGFLQVVSREWVLAGHRFATRLGVGRDDEQETAPVFLMFLDCVHQLLLQHPRAFQFSGELLVATMDAALSGRFGTFLYDCEREREEHRVASDTPCFFAWVLMRGGQFANRNYQAGGHEVLSANTSLKRLRVWDEWFLRHV